MTIEELRKEIGAVQGKVSALTRAYIRKILSMTEDYRWLGRDFTFKKTEIEDKIDDVLAELTATVLQLAERGMDDAVGVTGEADNRESVFAYVYQHNTDMSKYSRHLKSLLEGWIAIAFADKITGSSLLVSITAYMDNPYISPQWRKAIKDGGFQSDIIRQGGYRYGKGVPYSPVKGMTLIAENMINGAYQYSDILRFRRLGAIGYRVLRTTGYDCPVCDELTIGMHPLSEVVLPAHPRCRCIAEPVFLTNL